MPKQLPVWLLNSLVSASKLYVVQRYVAHAVIWYDSQELRDSLASEAVSLHITFFRQVGLLVMCHGACARRCQT